MAYEFTDDENKVVNVLARKLRLVSLVLIVFAILAGVLAGLEIKNGTEGFGQEFMNNLSMIITALLLLLFGIWFSSSATSFSKIVKTEGEDMEHLMSALGGLNGAFGLIYWAIVIAIIAIIALIIYTVATGAPPPQIPVPTPSS